MAAHIITRDIALPIDEVERRIETISLGRQPADGWRELILGSEYLDARASRGNSE